MYESNLKIPVSLNSSAHTRARLCTQLPHRQPNTCSGAGCVTSRSELPGVGPGPGAEGPRGLGGAAYTDRICACACPAPPRLPPGPRRAAPRPRPLLLAQVAKGSAGHPARSSVPFYRGVRAGLGCARAGWERRWRLLQAPARGREPSEPCSDRCLSLGRLVPLRSRND